MGTALSDARRKLFDLRKKYSAVSLQKYDKKSSASNESLIDLSDVSISSEVKNKKKDIIFSVESSLKSDSSGKNNKIGPGPTEGLFVTVSSNETVSRTYDSKINDIKSVTKVRLHSDDVSDGSEVKYNNNEEKISNSVNSSVKSQDPSEVEEVLLDENIETSSINDPFANIHLVSDDILEDLDSSAGSRSSIKDDVHTGRLSAIQSVKSLQLSSPLEPPRQDYDYESDFESSDIENESYSVPKQEDKENPTAVVVNNALFVHDEIDSDKEAASNKIRINHTFCQKNINKISTDSTKLPTDKFKIVNESIVHNLLTTDVKIKSNVSSDHLSTEDYNESIPEVFEDEEIIKMKSNYSSSEKSKTETKLSEIVTQSESGKNLNLENKKFNSKLSSPSIDKVKKSHSNRMPKNDIGVNVNLSNSSSEFYKNVNVYTSDRVVLANNKYEDVRPNIKSALREKWYINTNVKSCKHRPMVKSSKLFKSFNEKIHYNPFLFTVQDGLPIDKLLDEILRNQISMTKYFIECHHQLYLQCCKTVKSLNKDYKKSQTPLFI